VLSVLESPRQRRRLAFASALALLALLVYLGIHFSTPGSEQNASGPNVRGYTAPKTVPFRARDRRAVHRVLAEFIRTAVSRHDLDRAWDVAGPGLREGLTRKEWDRGNIPVTPYPAARHGQGSWSNVEYSYRKDVGLNVLVFPKRGSGYSVASVDVDVVKGRDRRWRVDYWMVTKLHGPGSTAPADAATALSEGPPNVHKLPGKRAHPAGKPVQHGQGARSAAAPAEDATHLGGAWWAIPLGLLSLVVLAPLAAMLAIWIRNRRAAAELERAKRS
jgi:hypothetical protein